MANSSELTRCLGCRVTDGEYDRVQKLSRAQGMTPSRYLRSLIRLASDPRWDGESGAVLIDRDSVMALEREINRQGHNLNQGVHALNSIALFFRHGKGDFDWLERRFDAAEMAFNVVARDHKEIVRLISALGDKIVLDGD